MSEDPGLQPQRTTLAWTRTAIVCGALTGILLRHAVVSGRIIDMVGTAVGGVMTLSVLVLGRSRRERIRRCLVVHRTPVVPHGLAALTVLTSTAALVVILSLATAGFR